MFKKVHLRLTLLCAAITAAIMTVMSVVFLISSEKELRLNQLQAFKNDINTITTNLGEQSVISMEWLSKMEAQGNYIFFITDNNIPFLYNTLKDDGAAFSREALLAESEGAYESMFETAPAVKSALSYELSHFEYEFASACAGNDFLASRIDIKAEASQLKITILYSLKQLENQLRRQRLRFILIDATAVIILSIFSYFFTGRLLYPVIENHKKQVMFTASASHELRTPLAVILSAAECCETAPPENKPGFLKTIRNEALRMSSLVSDMLTLSSSDGSAPCVTLKPVELDTLLINSYEAFKPLADKKEIELEISLPESALPPCMADSGRISQVVSILLHNALSYTPGGGKVRLSLTYKNSRGGGRFQISITDNGPGLSDEDKKKVFERFYRAEKARSSKEHFGLGLSIAKEIVSAHKGSITVRDADGGGCVFSVTLDRRLSF